MERSIAHAWRAAMRPMSRQTTTTVASLNPKPTQSWICTQCLHNPTSSQSALQSRLLFRSSRQRSSQQRRHQSTNNPADEPGFTSVVDNPPVLIRSGRKHNYLGLLILAAIPTISFGLGCWQVSRLGWKSDLIAKFEDRLIRDPLPLPPRIDPDAIKDFDYRRVYAKGKFRHDQEMLIGPRLHDGKDGYLVITPLERVDEHSPSTKDSDGRGSTTILVNRGWIPKDRAAPQSRPDGLPKDEVVVQGLLREPWKKNMFTPDNVPEEEKWYFPDVVQMAQHTGSQAVWIEETMKPDLLIAYDREAKGVPIGRAAEVNLRNNHTQYIFTWFSLSLATSIMMWMVIKKPARVPRQNRGW